METHGNRNADGGGGAPGFGNGLPNPRNGVPGGGSSVPGRAAGSGPGDGTGAPAPTASAGSAPSAGSSAAPVAAHPPVVGLAVSQRMYLPAGGGAQDLHAILTVRVEGVSGIEGADPGGAAPAPSLAEVLVVDCSASMKAPEKKIRAARQAAVTALKALPDGTPFAVVKGTHRAETVYPPSGPMRPASAQTRAEAERAVYAMMAGGGTCVGNWLSLAGELLAEQGAPIPHVLMLTDGRNEHDDRNPLAGVLDTWQGRFVCDAWGIGREWDARLLVRVTSRLHGSAYAVREESELPSAYDDLITGLLAKSLPELEIRVLISPGTRLRYLRQMFPTEGNPPQTEDGRAIAFTTRAWGNEVRRYQLCLTVDPAGRELGEDLQAALVEVAVPGAPPGSPAGSVSPGSLSVRLPPAQPCVVQWTDDPVLARTANEEVDHFAKHRQLGDTVALAADAFRLGRRNEAVTLLGVAVSLAHELGAQTQLAELQRIVEIRDPAAGHVVLRDGVQQIDFEYLITMSTHTTQGPTADGRPAGGVTVQPVAGLTDCPNCHVRVPSTAKFCPNCRHLLAPRVEAP
ncbi:von Willebrand factor type A domain-containing protein [Actinacidiphila yanglinensis]|uniref:von Willebrand factor type A domain-containing protein n=1 Tax=Actinacidiphila yanglinensis TaxID=310779 RepID=A0A1H5SD88_9ACTN|nr:VWA domain-containing protein [Actinacidiphila yanglinensis]SEF47948.1 von Willebrand factor type A domain-containing protein [Actinacidiphila yanglinensis]